MTITRVRLSLTEAFVSFDGGKSWWRLREDGTATLQFRTPPHRPQFGHEPCCDHECSRES